MQTILGANGTIGSLLAKELKAYTDDIRLVGRNPKKINATDELLRADLSYSANVDKAIKGSDIVYLLVGFEYNLQVWQEKWPKLMRATIDACVKYDAKLVFFDNVYAYDKNEISHMTEDSIMNPPSKKGVIRKQIAEMILNEIKSGKLTALIARSADFYGPDNDKSFVFQMIYKNIQKGKKPNWLVDADKKHSLTFTPDAAKATALLGNTPDAYNQTWHLPTDKTSITGREIVELFNKELKSEKKISVIPMWMFRILGIFVPIMREMPEMMYQYKSDYFFDSSKFEKRFNFKTTNYQDGVKWTIYLTRTEFKKTRQLAKPVFDFQNLFW